MATYLVTGGAGFIGSHIATALAERGDRVRVLDDLSGGRRENLAHLDPGAPGSGAPVELWVADVSRRGAALDACSGVDAVFHEAAQVSVPGSFDDPVRSYEINVLGTLQVLQAACARGVGSFVLAASSAAYGDGEERVKREDLPRRPLSPYASGKLAAEDLLRVFGQARGLRTVALRYFNVFGPRQADDSPYSGVIALFSRALLAGRQPTIFGDGLQTRDFVYVEDVVAANLAAAEAHLEPGSVLNVGTGEEVSLLDLHRQLAEITGTAGEPDFGPPRVGDVRFSCAAVERAREALGFRAATPLRVGLERTVEWYRSAPAPNPSR